MKQSATIIVFQERLSKKAVMGLLMIVAETMTMLIP